VTRPEEALELARTRAEQGRSKGIYGESGPGALEQTFVAEAPELATLGEWAQIEVEPGVLYSTRRLGGPVTAFKRLLLRLLRQYHVEVESQLTRYNIGLLARLRLLEARLDLLERSEGE
jgi:hypothetical protein